MLLNQDGILSKIARCTLDTLPRSLLLNGEYGCGKHSLCNYISEKFNLQQQEITECLNLDFIDSLYMRVEPALYIINAEEISVKEQNVILKFLEEPLKNAYIVLLCSSVDQLLPTITNRCVVWTFNEYSKEFLKSFASGDQADLIVSVAKTPGQVKELSLNTNIKDMIELADKIVHKIGVASLPNTFSISAKFNYKTTDTDPSKFNIKVFIRILINVIEECIKADNNPVYTEMYKLTHKLQKNSKVAHVDIRRLFEYYLVCLRELVRGGQV